MMLATGAGQESLEDAAIGTGHGLFTYYLVDGLTGLADQSGNNNQRITFAELSLYIKGNVPVIAMEKYNRKQEPFFCCEEKNNNNIAAGGQHLYAPLVGGKAIERWRKVNCNLWRITVKGRSLDIGKSDPVYMDQLLQVYQCYQRNQSFG